MEKQVRQGDDMEPRDGLAQPCVVLRQPPEPGGSGKGVLHHPVQGQEHEAVLGLHQLDHKRALSLSAFDERKELGMSGKHLRLGRRELLSLAVPAVILSNGWAGPPMVHFSVSYGTPVASPIASSAASPVKRGIVKPLAQAARVFTATDAATGLPYNLLCGIAQFADSTAASVGVLDFSEQFAESPSAQDFAVQPLPLATEGVSKANAGLALEGQAEIETASGSTVAGYLGFLFTRYDTFVRYYGASRIGHSPLPLLRDVNRIVSTKTIELESIQVDASGFHTGGIWDLLPTRLDVPAEYGFSEDLVE